MSDNTKRIEELKKELAGNPGSRQFYQLGELLRRDGRAAEAVPVLRAGLAKNPRYVAAWVALGRACMESGSGLEADAATALQEALTLDAQNPVAWRLLGEAKLATGHRAAALEAMERALALVPTDEVLRAAIDHLAAEPVPVVAQPEAAPPSAAGPAPEIAGTKAVEVEGMGAVIRVAEGSFEPEEIWQGSVEVPEPVPPSAGEPDAGFEEFLAEPPFLPAPDLAAPETGSVAPLPVAELEAPAAVTSEPPAVAPEPPSVAPEPEALAVIAPEPLVDEREIQAPPPAGSAEVPDVVAAVSEPSDVFGDVFGAPEEHPAAETADGESFHEAPPVVSVEATEMAPPVPVMEAVEGLAQAPEPPGEPAAWAEPPAFPEPGEDQGLAAEAPVEATAEAPAVALEEAVGAPPETRSEPEMAAPFGAEPEASAEQVPPEMGTPEPGGVSDADVAPVAEPPAQVIVAPEGAVVSFADVSPQAPVELPSAEPPATMTMARLYLHQQQLGAAVEVLETLLAREPDNQEAKDLLELVRDMMTGAPEPLPPLPVGERKIAALQRWLAGFALARERVTR